MIKLLTLLVSLAAFIPSIQAVASVAGPQIVYPSSSAKPIVKWIPKKWVSTNEGAHQRSPKGRLVGLILGLVIGALFLITILSIVIVIHIRQLRKRAAVKAGMPMSGQMVNVKSTPGGHDEVTLQQRTEIEVEGNGHFGSKLAV